MTWRLGRGVLLVGAAFFAVASPGAAVRADAAPLHATAGFSGPNSGDLSPDMSATPPTRILSLSPSATQMLYAIGAGHQVVGVDEYSTYPPGAPRTKFTGYETNAEDYLYLRPDLVVFAFRTSVIAQLRQLGIASLVLPPATSLTGVYDQILQLGAATGHLNKAKRVDSALAEDIASSVRRARGAGRGDTYYIEIDPTYYTAGSGTFIGSEFSLFGMRNIVGAAGGDGYPQIQPEFILKQNPDYVFLADTVCCHQTATTFAHRPGFAVLRAVKLHHVVLVNDSVASQWGPHTVELFVSLLARTLRP